MRPDRIDLVGGLRRTADLLDDAAEAASLLPGRMVGMPPAGAAFLADMLDRAAEELATGPAYRFATGTCRDEPTICAMTRAWLEITARMAVLFSLDSDVPALLTPAELAQIAQRAGLLETLAKAWPVLHAFDAEAAAATGATTGAEPRADRAEQGA